MIMKKTLVFFGTLLTTLLVYGQAKEGTVKYQDAQQPAAVIELPYPADVVNAAMKDYLSKKGKSRSTDIKGFITFRNTQPLQNDSVNADLYFKIEKKSRKEKEATVVSLLLMTNER